MKGITEQGTKSPTFLHKPKMQDGAMATVPSPPQPCP